MRSPFARGVGGVLSADIAVPEHDRELRFYSRILTTGSTPLWRDDLTNNRGTPVIGLGERSPEYDALPLQWMPHIQVSDVGASAARAVELGGSEIMHGKNDAGESQWAVLVDPAGAAFGLVAVVGAEFEVAYQADGSGCVSWLTLVVSDVGSACEFYEAVVGWSKVPAATDGGFEMVRPDGGSSAEIVPDQGEHARIPPVWILSLLVDDLAESLHRVCGGDGEVIAEFAGRAVIRDPVGVCIGLQGRGDG